MRRFVMVSPINKSVLVLSASLLACFTNHHNWQNHLVVEAFHSPSSSLSSTSTTSSFVSRRRQRSSDVIRLLERTPHHYSSSSSRRRRRQRRPSLQLYSNDTITTAAASSTASSSTTAAPEPWKAPYRISVQSQKRLSSIEHRYGRNHRNGGGMECATAVLRELNHVIPSHQLNDANVVHALMICSRCISGGRPKGLPLSDEYRSLFYQTTDVLHTLITSGRLTSKRLTHALYSMAKHVQRDPSLLEQKGEDDASLTTGVLSETWNLQQEHGNKDSQHRRVNPNTNDDDTNNKWLASMERLQDSIDTISLILTNVLLVSKGSSLAPPAIGELCMAMWSMGILSQRQRPAGWETPPQRGPLPRPVTNTNEKPSKSDALVTFTMDRSNDSIFGAVPSMGHDHTGDEEEEQHLVMNHMDKLYDAAAIYFMSTPETMTNDANYASVSGKPTVHSQQLPPRTKVDPVVRQANETWLQHIGWKELANNAWSYATHGQARTEAAETLMIGITQEASRRLQEQLLQSSSSSTPLGVLPRDIATVVWAIGTMQADNFHLVDDFIPLVDEVAQLWMDPTGNNDGNNDETMIRRLRPSYARRMYNADLVQMASGLARAGVDQTDLLHGIFMEAFQRLRQQRTGDTTTTSTTRDEPFQPWELSHLLWVQARLYLTGSLDRLYSVFARAVPFTLLRMLEEAEGATTTLNDIGIGQQEQANLAWSLTVLEEFQTPESVELLQRIFRDAASNSDNHSQPSRRQQLSNNDMLFQLEHAHQLWQALFLLEEECPEAVKDVPKWFRDFLHDEWDAEKSRTKLSSYGHRDLSDTLHQMGVAHYNEHDEDIDVAIVLKQQKSKNKRWTSEADTGGSASNDDDGGSTLGGIDDEFRVAVEFDGPMHFTRIDRQKKKNPESDDETTLLAANPFQKKKAAPPPRALGHTVLKYRLLKRQGWVVVRVPFYEFDKIPRWASMERQRYLQRLLKTHANIRFNSVDFSEYKPLHTSNRQSRYD